MDPKQRFSRHLLEGKPQAIFPPQALGSTFENFDAQQVLAVLTQQTQTDMERGGNQIWDILM